MFWALGRARLKQSAGEQEPMLETGRLYSLYRIVHLHHHASLLKSSIKQEACFGAWTYPSTHPIHVAPTRPDLAALQYIHTTGRLYSLA
jgi:hypothetical protein